MNKRYIYATNIDCGGGLELLKSIVEDYDGIERITIFANNKFLNSLPKNKHINFKYQPHAFYYRIFFEIYLLFIVNRNDQILFFGNLSPLFRYKAKVSVFIQNTLLFEKLTIKNNSLFFQKIWFQMTKNNSDKFIVQTPTMVRLLKEKVGGSKNILQLPFCKINIIKKLKKQFLYDFIYVASGLPHKNHIILIKAWKILAKEGLFPSLILTFDFLENKNLSKFLAQYKKRYALNIQNIGFVKHDNIYQKYNQTKALIYPSLKESFGLPLIEASKYGLDILSSNYEFVKDIIRPNITFDPQSPKSIADSVKFYLNNNQKNILRNNLAFPNKNLKINIFQPKAFINKVFD